MFDKYLQVKPCKTGKGVFTTVQIPANQPVIEITGPVVLEEDLPLNHSSWLQVGVNTFIGLSGGPDDYLNHSCNPNCAVHVTGNRAILYSLYVIQPGSELTFDYSTTSTDSYEKWSMNCECGSFNCRGVISGHHTLDWETKEKYRRKGFLPLYVTHPEMVQKRFK